MRVRCGKPRGKGRSSAVKLATWYVKRSGLGTTATRRDVNKVKALIASAGNVEGAERILKRHLSDSWRWKNQKPLEFVLSNLDRYRRELGMISERPKFALPKTVEVIGVHA
jgi:hypothetical protein